MSPIKGPSVIAQGYGEARLGDRMSKSEGGTHKFFKERLLLFVVWYGLCFEPKSIDQVVKS